MVKAVLGILTFISIQSQAASDFVTSPDPRLTPGSFCDQPDSYRFDERIPYCERDVESHVKKEIIRLYDARLGTHIEDMNRSDFKIDHLIPLCLGGSNEVSNLWPQHKSTFNLTDPVEHKTCELMGAKKLKHQEAVHYVREAKQNPQEALKILAKITHL